MKDRRLSLLPARASGAIALALCLVAAPLGGCSDQRTPAPAGPTVSIAVAALSFPAVSDVLYRVTVRNASGKMVWTRDASSSRYGDGGGALTLVGPCDASAGESPNVVQLELVDLLGPGSAPLATGSWQNPAPVGSPLEQSASCGANQDTLVTFNLTVMRQANQGFFDVVVNFEDIFCSAKFDCGRQLLFDPATEARASTVVLGFACTAGQGGQGDPEPTWLHLTDVALRCDGMDPIYFDPSQEAGQHGPLGAGAFFESAIYRGKEQIPGYDKCYWNMAFGVSLAAHPKHCRLVAQGTASAASFAPGHMTPENTVFPYVSWSADITDGDGNLACSQHALNSGDGVVATSYTPPGGAPFRHEWRCGAPEITTEALACAGSFSDSSTAQLYPTPEGLSVAIGGQRSPSYKLPPGFSVGGGSAATCCANPCCSE